MVTQEQTDLQRSVAAARQQLEQLQARRDGIVAQLAQLRDVVASFGAEDAEEETQEMAGPDEDPESTTVMEAMQSAQSDTSDRAND